MNGKTRCRDPTGSGKMRVSERISERWGSLVTRPKHNVYKILVFQGFEAVFSFGGNAISPNGGKVKKWCLFR